MSSIYWQSFDRRIYDDLCSHILSYLSFEERLRLESVSKQFRRTIHNNQIGCELWLNSNDFEKSVESIETLLKKCKTIYRMVIECDFDGLFTNKVIELINSYCISLSYIECNLNYIREDIYHQFIYKFAKTLKRFKNYDYSDYKLFVNYIITSLGRNNFLTENNNCYTYADPFHSKLPQIGWKQLAFGDNIEYYPNELHEQIEINNNINTLCRLYLQYNIESDEQLSHIFQQISRLSQLKYLIIKFNMIDNNIISSHPLSEFLENMSESCLKLRIIKFNFQINNPDIILFKAINRFLNLNYLNINLLFDFHQSLHLDFNNMFKGLKLLTQLSIKIYFNNIGPNNVEILVQNNNKLFENIINCLPNLYYFETNCLINEQTFKLLSKLSKLQTLKLYINPNILNYENIEYLVNNCRKINNIYFEHKETDQKKIDSIIESIRIGQKINWFLFRIVSKSKSLLYWI